MKKEQDIDLLDGVRNKEIIKAIEKPLDSYDQIFRQLLPEQQIKLFLVKKIGEEGGSAVAV